MHDTVAITNQSSSIHSMPPKGLLKDNSSFSTTNRQQDPKAILDFSHVVVKKFGGTSVGSIERIENVAERICEDIRNGQTCLVVASAQAGETNRLVRLANDVDPLHRGPAYDMLLATGEQVSIALLSMALAKRGVKSQPLLAHQIGIYTDSLFSKARILRIEQQKIADLLNSGIVPVIAGFQGVTDEDQITTLGRGGSDTTAVALAAALPNATCEIYTDVPAISTADPRLVPKAREIPKLRFEEMMEMASLGSKVLQIRSVEMAMKFGVALHVRSTFERRHGTWVVPEGDDMESPVVSSVTHDYATVVFKLFPLPIGEGFKAQLFESLAEKGIVVDIITQSQNQEGQRLAFSVSEEDALLTEKLLRDNLQDHVSIEIMREMAKVSTIGVGMRNHPGVAARFFKVMNQHQVPIHLVTTSEIKISAVIDKSKLQTAAQALHSEFGLDV